MASFYDVLQETGAIDPKTFFPPAPTPPPQPNIGGMGGLGGIVPSTQQGGARGFFNQPGVYNALQALGSSLMTSPRNNPMANFADFYDRYNARYQRQQEGMRDRGALKQVLMQYGATADEAERLSYNSTAAELWLKQRTAERGLAADDVFNKTLTGIGDTGNSGDPFAGSGVDAAPKLSDRRPITIDGELAGAPRQDGSRVAADDVGLPGASTGRLNGLLQLRDRYLQAATNARTDDQRAKAKLYLDSIDKSIAREEERMKPTEALRDLSAINEQRRAAGLQPYRLDEWQQMKARSGATNIDLKGETKYDETFNTEMAKRAIGIEDQATSARKSLGTLKLMEKAIADPGFYSGTGSGAVTSLKRLANGLGLPGADGIDSIEAFNAMSKQAALDAMGGSLGTGFSNADRSFVEEQVANLGNTPEGNKALINIQRATANRQLEIAKLARAYAEKNGGRIDAGFYDRLARWAEANPLFTGDTDIFSSGSGRQGRVGGGSGRASSSTGPSRQRATNPNTGETVEWDGTQWRPVQ